MPTQSASATWMAAATSNPIVEYALDFAQRGILYGDGMRERGNQYLAHMAQATPNVLNFTVEPVMSGRDLPRPVTRAIVASVALLSLGACAARTPDQSQAAAGEVPAQVLALAGPYQDLQTVWLNPEDGCYWYRHAGEVETTMLPLRTGAGKVICLQNSDAPSAAG